MAENEPQPENKGLFQKVLDKFKTTSKEVADKVGDTVEDVKNSEFAGKVTDAAKSVSDKAKDIAEDVKNSEFADKVGDVKDAVVDKVRTISTSTAKFCSDKIKKVIGKIDFDDTLDKLKEKQASSGKDLSKVINFVEKLQNIK